MDPNNNNPGQAWSDVKVLSEKLYSVRFALGLCCFFLSIILICVLGVLPSGMSIISPGPVLPILGFGDRDLVKYSAHLKYSAHSRPAEPPNITFTKDKMGKLLGLSVFLNGSPDRQLPVAVVALNMLNNRFRIIPMNHLYPPGVDNTRFNREEKRSMQSSKDLALEVAMRKLGLPVLKKVIVDFTEKGFPADGKLFPEDEILQVDDYKITSSQDLLTRIENRPLKFKILRSRSVLTVDITPVISDNRPMIGLFASDRVVSRTNVEFSDNDAGGSSAGLVFSLAVYELLSGRGITEGLYVAGTGAIDSSGHVMPVSGVPQKMLAAYDAGARIMILPQKNCADLRGFVPKDMAVYSVNSFDEAIMTLEKLRTGDEQLRNRCA